MNPANQGPVLIKYPIAEIARTYLKNGRLRSKLDFGAERWISKTNNGQLWNPYFQKYLAERMAKAAREWMTERS